MTENNRNDFSNIKRTATDKNNRHQVFFFLDVETTKKIHDAQVVRCLSDLQAMNLINNFISLLDAVPEQVLYLLSGA